jgi:hypothetical protein
MISSYLYPGENVFHILGFAPCDGSIAGAVGFGGIGE